METNTKYKRNRKIYNEKEVEAKIDRCMKIKGSLEKNERETQKGNAYSVPKKSCPLLSS